MTKKRRTKNQLKIVFDTSALFTSEASDLLKHDVSELTQHYRDEHDLSISWHLPEVVRQERKYQMLQKALTFLGPIGKLEKLLGHNLNITEEILDQRIDTVIKSQVENHGLDILDLDVTRVDWRKTISDAVFRRAPFEAGEKEKGFRDSLILESFLQLVDASPKSSENCWIVLVTGDKALSDAVKTRTEGITNVRIFTSLEEVKGLINTASSTVDEAFVEALQGKAKRYFFDPGNNQTLYYKEDLRNKIFQRFSKELSSVPNGADIRENGTVYVNSPRFLKKEGRRVFWATRIEVEAKAYRQDGKAQSLGFRRLLADRLSSETAVPYMGLSTPLSESKEYTLLNLRPSGVVFDPTRISVGPSNVIGDQPFISNVYTSIPDKTLVRDGRAVVEVTWSFNLNPSGRPTRFKIDDIKFIETTWNEVTTQSP